MKPLDHTEIRGNWATLLLATGPDGTMDYARLEEEIDILIDSRPCGIYSNGTAGEFYSQDEEEFLHISELLSAKCEAAGVPYQIGVSHPCAQRSLERLRAVRRLKPGAVQVILPDWFPVSDAEAVDFLKVMEQEAEGIPLVLYNPPHAKRRLAPGEWMVLKREIPSLAGVKVFDNDCDPAWYDTVNREVRGLSVFVPGHHLATGVRTGMHGAYSNVACLNPYAAQRWYEQMLSDLPGALELEKRIGLFMASCITPFITEHHYPNHACDRFMALVGGWCDAGDRLRWPYRSIPADYAETVRRKARNIIPEFFPA